jgi:hypothetical protein
MIRFLARRLLNYLVLLGLASFLTFALTSYTFTPLNSLLQRNPRPPQAVVFRRGHAGRRLPVAHGDGRRERLLAQCGLAQGQHLAEQRQVPGGFGAHDEALDRLVRQHLVQVRLEPAVELRRVLRATLGVLVPDDDGCAHWVATAWSASYTPRSVSRPACAAIVRASIAPETSTETRI